MRSPITKEQWEAACSVAADVFDGKLQVKAGASSLEKEHGLNITSATDLIRDYKHMVLGEKFLRGMSASAMEHFVLEIYRTRGASHAFKAIRAVELHIQTRSPMHKMEKTLNEVRKHIGL